MLTRLFPAKGPKVARPASPRSDAAPPFRRSITVGVPELTSYTDESISGQFARTIGSLHSAQERTQLRKYVRQATRDNPLVIRFRTLLWENVIGPDGLTLQMAPRILGSARAEVLRQAQESEWYRWAAACGLQGESLLEIQRHFEADLRLLGEAFCEIIETPTEIRLRPIPPELVDDDYSTDGRSGPRIVNGVEVNADGAPVAFHVLERVSTEYSTSVAVSARRRRRVPVERMLYDQVGRMPGQTRARPPIAGALLRLLLLNKMQESLVHLHMVAASAGGFITQSSEADGDGRGRELYSGATSMPMLDPGQDVKAFIPGTPTPQYQQMYDTLVREVASAFGVSAVALTGNVSDANYSSQRISLLADRDTYRVWQQDLADHFNEPLLALVLRKAVTTGRLFVNADVIGAPGADWLAHEWHGRPFDWIDPQKEAAGIEIALKNHLTTLTREYARRGLDFRAAMIERAEELRFLAEQLAGVPNPAADDAPARVLPLTKGAA